MQLLTDVALIVTCVSFGQVMVPSRAVLTMQLGGHGSRSVDSVTSADDETTMDAVTVQKTCILSACEPVL